MTMNCKVGKAHLICDKSSAYGFGASDPEGPAQSAQSVDGIFEKQTFSRTLLKGRLHDKGGCSYG